jgi:hypothetical protein
LQSWIVRAWELLLVGGLFLILLVMLVEPNVYDVIPGGRVMAFETLIHPSVLFTRDLL